LEASSPGDNNKKIAARWVQAINEQDYALFDEVISPDLIWHGSAGYEEIRRGRDAFKQMFIELAEPFRTYTSKSKTKFVKKIEWLHDT